MLIQVELQRNKYIVLLTMTTQQKYSLLLFYLSLLWTTASQFVDCPNTTVYAKCNGCYQDSLVSVGCACDNYQMGVLGICIYPPYPCYSTYLPYMYDPTYSEFNIWTQLVQPFWQKKLEQAKTNASPPNPLPKYINNYDFKTMGDSYKRGWLIGYYLYQSFYSEISALSIQKQAQKLFQAVNLSQTILNYTIVAKWVAANNFFNSLFATNYTTAQFMYLVYEKIQKILPCHDCSQFYGTFTGNLVYKCQKCPPNCNTCQKNTSQCTQCYTGNYLKNGLCQKCKVGRCLNCNQTNCLKCGMGYSLTNNKCVPCERQGGCVTCLDAWPGTCTICLPVVYSYFSDQSGVCYVCQDPKCIVCYYDKTSCLYCTNGYYSNNQYVCKQCKQNCDQCTSSTACISCRKGYGLINGACKPCRTAGCLHCDNDLTLCSACWGPYFQYNYNTGLCELTSVTTVDQAQSISGETDLCRPGCLLCYNNNTDLCFKCHQRYYMQNRYCKKCMPGCIWCDDANTCKECISGYVVFESKCVRCPDNCRQCSSTNTSLCQDCRHGYYLVNNICKASTTPECYIFDANQNQNCLVCLPGFTVSNDSKCIQCQMNCAWSCNPRNISECTSSRYFLLYQQNFKYRVNESGCYQDINGNCLEPEQMYDLYNNSGKIATKRICNHPCETCNSTYCFSCQPGYLYSKGKCSVNTSCNPSCTKCLPGTERNTNTNNCETCIENCGSCLNGNCLECFNGFYKQGQTCLKCPQKCQTCYDSINCATCAVGYIWPQQLYYYSYDCVKCNQNCLTCKFQPNLCLSCPAGKKLKYFKCINQHHIAFQYRLNYQYSSFLAKAKSQVLIDELRTALNANFNDFFIYNISNGSTIFEGVYSASNSSSAISSYQTLKDYKLQGFEIIGSSFALMNDTQVVDCSSSGSSSCPQSSKLSTGAIAGIVIGSVGFAALVAGAVFLFVQSNKKEKEVKINENKGQMVGQSKLESKNTLKTEAELTETAKSIVKI